jgi:hypothetical protein
LIGAVIGLLLFIVLGVWLIKSSIRRAVRSAQESIGIELPAEMIESNFKAEKKLYLENFKTKNKKIESEKVVDLRKGFKK